MSEVARRKVGLELGGKKKEELGVPAGSAGICRGPVLMLTFNIGNMSTILFLPSDSMMPSLYVCMVFNVGCPFLKEVLKQIKQIMLVTARKSGKDKSMDCPFWVSRKSQNELIS